MHQDSEGPSSRRSFIASLGAMSALAVWPPGHLHAGQLQRGQQVSQRGLAADANDFLFAPELVYLQTGSLGPTPRPVMEKTIATWRELELNPVYYGYGPHEQAMEATRANAAAFIGCTTHELVLTRSTTEGMNWVAQGLGLASGDRVLTTDQEHPGGRACWDYVARKFGVAIDVVVIPPGENDALAILDRVASQLTSRTRVLSISHVLSSTGLRMPVAELSALARARGALSVVDGAQAVGGIVVDVKALGCDVYATSGHKWLLAPKGTGFLYLNAAIGQAVDPIALQGGRAAYSNSSGVTSLPSVLGLSASIDYVRAIGIGAVERHNLMLRNRLYDAMREVPTIRVVSAPAGPLASPLLTYVLPDSIPSHEFMQRLSDRHHLVVKTVPAQWLNGNRISTHLFNTEQDVDALVVALRRELA